MKKASILMAIVLIVTIAGCATPTPVGSIYTSIKLPVTATSNGGGAMKTGTSSCTSILTLVAFGDASIETAKQNGGITKIHHVDWDAQNILGIVGTYTVTVYGE